MNTRVSRCPRDARGACILWKIHLARGRWQAAELKVAEIAAELKQAEEARTSLLEDKKRERGANLRGGPLPELMTYLRGAAANGSPAGQYALACHYEIGAGVPRDRARARVFSWADNNATCSTVFSQA